MLLDFKYSMELRFSQPVRDQYFSLLCLPRDTERQKIIKTEIYIEPGTHTCRDTDGLGNLMIYGAVFEPHDSFGVIVSGQAETLLSPHEEYEEPGSPGLYRYAVPSGLTVPGPELKVLYSKLQKDAPDDDYGKLLYYNAAVRSAMEYAAGITDSHTTAESALAAGSGVCQDFSHVLTAVLRMAGIPARYAVGMMIGEGESHAWTEANCGGYWYGVDPANGLLIDETYIKLSHGRDYTDCMISRGIFTNPNAVQSMQVSVQVKPSSAPADM